MKKLFFMFFVIIKTVSFSSQNLIETENETGSTSSSGGLVIISHPAGAAVYIDNKKVGETPYEYEALASGIHELKIIKELYKEITKSIEIEEGRVIKEELHLQEDFSTVYLNAPETVELFANGRKKGNGKSKIRLKTGAHYLEAKIGDYILYKNSVLLETNNDIEIDLSKLSYKGGLKITVEPKQAKNASVYLDDQYIGPASKQIPDLEIGKHDLKLKCLRFKDYNQFVTIEYKQNKKINVIMKTIYDNPHLLKDKWRKRRNIAFVITAISTAVGFGFDAMADNKNNDYKVLNTHTKNELSNSKKRMRKISNNCYTITGIGLLWTLFNQIRMNSVIIPECSFSLNSNFEYNSIVFAYNF